MSAVNSLRRAREAKHGDTTPVTSGPSVELTLGQLATWPKAISQLIEIKQGTVQIRVPLRPSKPGAPYEVPLQNGGTASVAIPQGVHFEAVAGKPAAATAAIASARFTGGPLAIGNLGSVRFGAAHCALAGVFAAFLNAHAVFYLNSVDYKNGAVRAHGRLGLLGLPPFPYSLKLDAQDNNDPRWLQETLPVIGKMAEPSTFQVKGLRSTLTRDLKVHLDGGSIIMPKGEWENNAEGSLAVSEDGVLSMDLHKTDMDEHVSKYISIDADGHLRATIDDKGKPEVEFVGSLTAKKANLGGTLRLKHDEGATALPLQVTMEPTDTSHLKCDGSFGFSEGALSAEAKVTVHNTSVHVGADNGKPFKYRFPSGSLTTSGFDLEVHSADLDLQLKDGIPSLGGPVEFALIVNAPDSKRSILEFEYKHTIGIVSDDRDAVRMVAES